jgi:putative protein kinase ArgK-like GTPase of G3E family
MNMDYLWKQLFKRFQVVEDHHVEEHKVVTDLNRDRRWKDVINIGITGEAGAGKASFINAIRR